MSVFLVVDVQNDFISGTLNISQCAAQQNGLDVVDPINRLLDTVEFDAVFYSLDWHPSDHVSFIDNLPYRKVHDSSPVSVPPPREMHAIADHCPSCFVVFPFRAHQYSSKQFCCF